MAFMGQTLQIQGLPSWSLLSDEEKDSILLVLECLPVLKGFVSLGAPPAAACYPYCTHIVHVSPPEMWEPLFKIICLIVVISIFLDFKTWKNGETDMICTWH